MKKILKFAALSALALTFAGCASNQSNADMVALKASVEEARNAAVQSNQTAQAAYELAVQNAEKINRVWRKSQMK